MFWLSLLAGMFLGVCLGILILGWRRWRKSRGERDSTAVYSEPLPFPTVENRKTRENNLRAEARQHRRFRVLKGEAMTVLFPTTEDLPLLSGQILDLSRGGLALAYSAGEEKGREGLVLHLEIYGTRPPFLHIENVPGRIVYDRETQGAQNVSSTTRRCGVRFGELTESQSSQLEGFLRNFTVCEV